MLIFVINPGATSTKLAVFEDEQERWKTSIEHSREDLAPFAHVVDQLDYRLTLIEAALDQSEWKDARFDAVCGRGGLLRHLPSGTY
ncbi:MAG: butyrate kinase, partial [Clostridia bacterium]|nr:butyrate kinase [Clostridia bacterium]